jgi:hypothetical protein
VDDQWIEVESGVCEKVQIPWQRGDLGFMRRKRKMEKDS